MGTEQVEPVALALLKFGACTTREVAACCGLPREEVEACLHLLGSRGAAKIVAVVYHFRSKKSKRARPTPIIYWVSSLQHGSVKEIRDRQKERFPEVYATARRGRELKQRPDIKAAILRVLDVTPPRPTIDVLAAIGFSYNSVNRKLHELEAEGLVVAEKEQTGRRGRPSWLWSLVEKPTGEVETTDEEAPDEDDEVADLEWE